MKKYLVTGTNSGLGKFLQEHLNAVSFSRQDGFSVIKNTISKPFDVIIHCAFNMERGITSATLQQYISDNLLLTEQLLTIPHKKFIFISSADVYPKNIKFWKEENEFPIDQVKGLYGLNKLIAEMIVKEKTNNHLILRLTALLGRYARPNSLMRVLYDTEPTLTLDANSDFNYILHEDVLSFIKIGLENNINGVFNLAASSNITLGEVASLFKRKVNFGSYAYNTAALSNEKVISVCDIFSNSSLENIKRFQVIMEGIRC